MRPRVNFGLPSTMSSGRMLTSLIFLNLRKLRAICEFWSIWTLILPLSRGNCCPDKISSKDMRLSPSLRSSKRSVIILRWWGWLWGRLMRCLLTHLVKVFFWMPSLSSEEIKDRRMTKACLLELSSSSDMLWYLGVIWLIQRDVVLVTEAFQPQQ